MRALSIVSWRLAFGALLVACPDVWAQDARVTIHLKTEPLAQALIDFAVQAKLSISVSELDFNDALGNPVDGTYTQAGALKALLAGSGFAFTFLDATSVEIRPSHAANSIEPRSSPVEMVVVSASKRNETAQEVPYSVSVVSGTTLTTFGSDTVRSLSSQVAGLTSTNLGPGEDKVFVRGLTDSVVPGLSESVVGLYLDEARIADDAPDPDLRLVDIDRVEVLSGPQGTLYGAGSLTGLVRIVTRQPVYDDFQSAMTTSVSETESGGLSKNIDGMLNFPIIDDTLAVRLVGYGSTEAGYVDNSRLHLTDTNRTDVDGGRLSIGWAPDGVWSVSANVVLQGIHASDSQYYLLALGPYNRDNYLPEPHADHFLESGVTVHGNLGWADFTSSTAFVDRTYATLFDASFAWTSLTGFPTGPSSFDFHRSIQSITQESRLVSEGSGRWRWLVGISLDHRDEDFLSTLAGPNAGLVDILAREELREDRLNEAAIFGETTYAFSSSLSLTGGIRAYSASHIVKATSEGLLANTPAVFNGTNRQPGVVPKLVLKYEADSDETYYAQYSQGYRLGGLNVDGPEGVTGENSTNFDSDSLRNYEIGAKIRFFDDHVYANAAAYYEDWSNVQSDEFAPDGAFYIVNAGNVRDPGVELELGATPLQGLLLKANAFWNNPSLVQSSALRVKDASGLPGAPSVSAGLSVEYVWPIADEISGFAALNDSYVGSSHLGFAEATPSMGNYNLANLRLGASRGAWQATMFIDNLTADHGNTFAFGNPFNGEAQITPPRPRTVGLSVEWRE